MFLALLLNPFYIALSVLKTLWLAAPVHRACGFAIRVTVWIWVGAIATIVDLLGKGWSFLSMPLIQPTRDWIKSSLGRLGVSGYLRVISRSDGPCPKRVHFDSKCFSRFRMYDGMLGLPMTEKGKSISFAGDVVVVVDKTIHVIKSWLRKIRPGIKEAKRSSLEIARKSIFLTSGLLVTRSL